MSWLYFVIGCLATFRLSLLVSREDGPAYIFRKLRKAPPARSSAKEGLSCPWCMSVWMSAAVTCAYWYWDIIPTREVTLFWLAFSGGAICINQTFTKS